MDRGEARRGQIQPPKMSSGENQQNHRVSPAPISDNNTDGHGKRDNKMIDLNIKPHRMHGQASNNQVRFFSWFMFLQLNLEFFLTVTRILLVR